MNKTSELETTIALLQKENKKLKAENRKLMQANHSLNETIASAHELIAGGNSDVKVNEEVIKVYDRIISKMLVSFTGNPTHHFKQNKAMKKSEVMQILEVIKAQLDRYVDDFPIIAEYQVTTERVELDLGYQENGGMRHFVPGQRRISFKIELPYRLNEKSLMAIIRKGQDD